MNELDTDKFCTFKKCFNFQESTIILKKFHQHIDMIYSGVSIVGNYVVLDVAKKAKKIALFTVNLIGKLNKNQNKHLNKESKQSVQR
jgi:hypothetical protein